jgi:hypothetical protein
MRYFVIVAFLFLVSENLFAQKVSGNAMPDSVPLASGFSGVIPLDSCRNLVLKNSTLPLGIPGKPAFQKSKLHRSGDWYFYYYFLLLLFFALIKLAYPRYFHDLFRVFFRTSLKVNQIKEQLAASLWQSLLYNVLFFLAAGFYLFLIFRHFKYVYGLNDFMLLFTCTLVLLAIYAFKYLFLRFTGWLLGVNQAADTYIFVVFLINKMAGIMLLPAIAVIAFASVMMAEVIIGVSLATISVFILYRSLLGYQTAMTVSKLSNFHFLLYILAMEIAPLLVLFRVLLTTF